MEKRGSGVRQALVDLAGALTPLSLRDLQAEIEERLEKVPNRINEFGYDPYGLAPDWLRRAALRRKLAAFPGARADNAIVADSFDTIDAEVARRRCHCGGRYDVKGESSAARGGRRLRAVGLECKFCEERIRVYFDVSGLFH